MSRKPNSSTTPRSRALPLWLTYVLALSILGGTILPSALSIRTRSRQQIIRQHAELVYALWQSQKSEEPELSPGTPERAADELPAVLETAHLPLLKEASMGTRFFNAAGEFLFGDPNVAEARLGQEDLNQLRSLTPVAHFKQAADLTEVLPTAQNGSTWPLLYINIPLHSAKGRQLVAVAQFIFDGKKLRVPEFYAGLDRNLTWQALATFIVAGGLLGLVLGLGFHQLQRVNRLLNERTQSLLRANQELALAAKTSAVGAVTAHLIHGLKNPLSGLQTFVASRGAGTEEEESDWELAVSSTRRMQTMINEIVRVLRDEEADSQYEMTTEEFVGMLRSKVMPLARDAGVEFRAEVTGQGALRNREANLINLILYNLVHNAIQATPQGKRVTLSLRADHAQIVCEVADQGPGIPEANRANLFKPCRSSKEGGSGIGLAISRQLAGCIGANLDLKQTGADGTIFVLSFSARSENLVPAWAEAEPTAAGDATVRAPSVKL
jgi:signal transduction histidine kinase